MCPAPEHDKPPPSPPYLTLTGASRAARAAIKDAQLKEARRRQECLTDLRVAGAIGRRACATADGTARHAAASQLAASAMAALFGARSPPMPPLHVHPSTYAPAPPPPLDLLMHVALHVCR